MILGWMIHGTYHPWYVSCKRCIIQGTHHSRTKFWGHIAQGRVDIVPWGPTMGSFTNFYCTDLSVSLDKVLYSPILCFPTNHCLWVLEGESVCFGQMFVCTANRFRKGGGVKGGGGGEGGWGGGGEEPSRYHKRSALLISRGGGECKQSRQIVRLTSH